MINLLKLVEKYLKLRRMLGFDLHNAEHILKSFVSYMNQMKVSHITAKIALEFATKNSKSSITWQAKKLGIIRIFASYVSMYDAKTQIISKDLLPNSYHRRLPYIFSDEEIIKLLEACRDLPVLRTFFGLIAVTGMRTSEALELRYDAVDLEKGIITITESKLKKSRKIPIHPSTTKALKEYSELRSQWLKNKTSEYFFVNKHGQKLTKGVQNAFRKTCNLVGILKKGNFYPRILDLRHTFAVKTLVNSYKTDIHADTVIPILAMYLGHENPKHTYWYLTATPELMGLIVERLEKKLGGK